MNNQIYTSKTSDSGVPIAVMGWPADTAGCGTYRILGPLTNLATKHKVQVEIGTKSNYPFTILVAQRTQGEEQTEFLRTIKKNRQTYNNVSVPKIVYELDDDFWSIEMDNPGYDHYHTPGVLERIAESISLADLVTVSTSPLVEVVKKYNDNVVVLPNSVPELLTNENINPYTVGFGKPYVLGWAGSATHLNDFNQCVSGLNTFMRLNPNVRLVFFGTDYSGLLDPVVRPNCRVAPWVNSVDKFYNLLSKAQIDVMLAPLYPSKFNESKSNLRILEANSLGIPVIASNFGPYADSGPGTRLVDLGSTWVSHLNDLQNPLLRVSMSNAGRQWVRDNYLIEKNVDLWLDAYKRVLND